MRKPLPKGSDADADKVRESRMTVMDERIKKLAYGLVNHSCHVQKGEKVYIHYTGYSTTELAKQLIRSIPGGRDALPPLYGPESPEGDAA